MQDETAIFGREIYSQPIRRRDPRYPQAPGPSQHQGKPSRQIIRQRLSSSNLSIPSSQPLRMLDHDQLFGTN